ncbi:hypothetical protein [Streptomyces sp. NPDC047070]|uniref:hypothetical protein n=1 Tax=Streptomyces sp. NPDC047070 TaxID=3154923 RepID=UPI0034543130
MPLPVRRWLHVNGWLASPSLAWTGVLFGPQKRDLAGEVMAEIARSHDEEWCGLCTVPDEERV